MAAIDVMRRYLEAVQRGDWRTGFGFFADDIVLHVPGRSSLAGEHRGREAATARRLRDRADAGSGLWKGTGIAG